MSPFLKGEGEARGILNNEEISKNPQSDKSDSSFNKGAQPVTSTNLTSP
jgi:hypothetical protein